MAVIFLNIMLLTTCGTSVAICLYAVHGNTKSPINRLFCIMGCILAIWAFGLALTISAQTEEIRAIGRRLAAPGWGFMVCVTLHFILLLTGETALLKKWWIYPPLYLLGAVTFFGQTVLPLAGRNTDELIRTGLGWVNISEINGWDRFCYVHTFAFMAICMGLLIRWKKRSASAGDRKQAGIMISGFILAAVLSAAADIIQVFLGIRIPQIVPVFMLFPILSIGYSVNWRYFLKPEATDPNEIILDKKARTHVYRYMSLAAFGISVVLIIGRDILFSGIPVGPFSAFWAVSGAMHALANRLGIDDQSKEMLEAFHFSFLIPVACLWFGELEVFTMWALVFPMMIISLLFNRHIILNTIIVSSFLTQLLNWAYRPVAYMNVAGPAYLMRIIMILFIAVISIYVHRVYTGRLEENAAHAHMQSIISEISHDLIFVGEQNIDEKFHRALERCGKYIQCDRSYLVLLDGSNIEISHSWEWLAEGVSSQLNSFKAHLKDMYPMMCKQLKSQDIIMLRDAASLPPMAGKAKKLLAEQNIRALMCLPIKKQGKLLGFLGFNSEQPFTHFNIGIEIFLKIMSDIIADALTKVTSEREINSLAYHDQLTHLSNRTLFHDRLKQAIDLAKRNNTMIGVAFIDLDSFKYVNDTMGHDLGDCLLTRVADILSRTVRKYDTVARQGGDEFILLLNQISGTKELMTIMDYIMDAVQKPVMLNQQEFFVTVSAGLAVFPQDGQDAETLVKNADLAMYSAKRDGKNRYALCSEEMKEEIFKKTELTNFLYRALEKNQLILHYQPQIDIKTKSITGVEALIRWRLDGRNLIMPTTFIPLAEQTGLIQPIGEWVLRTACSQNKLWQDKGFSEFRMAVNVSVHQLKNPKFPRLVEDALRKTGLAPEYLELEITESVANENTESIMSALNNLKKLGILISIDDFGTEYSSLSRLKLLPVDRIKMDMQFVQGIEVNKKDQAISKVIIDLAKSLNLKVIAEGVETVPQYEFLSQRMCDEVQGYFFYKPMTADEIEGILKKNQQAK